MVIAKEKKLDKVVKFISPRYPAQTVILEPSYSEFIGTHKKFVAGTIIKFYNGWYETNDAHIIALLRESKYLGVARGWYEDKSFETPEEISRKIKARNTMEQHNYYCKICLKGFETGSQMAGHMRSNAHKAAEKTNELAGKVHKGAIG